MCKTGRLACFRWRSKRNSLVWSWITYIILGFVPSVHTIQFKVCQIVYYMFSYKLKIKGNKVEK